MEPLPRLPEKSGGLIGLDDNWCVDYPEDFDYSGNEMTGNSLKEASMKEYEVKEVKGEATVEYSTGGMSSHLSVDYSLMPNVEFVEDVIEVLTLGCTEHGGKYPRDNWKKLPVMDNSTHALQHMLKLHGNLLTGEANTEELMVDLTHAVCRLWFLHYQILKQERPSKSVDKNYTLGE